MKKQLYGIISGIIIFILLCSGIFTDIIRFFSWLFLLDYSAPDISIVGSIIVRVLTFTVSYSLVGIIFKVLNWFNSKIMSITYLIFSSLIGFALSYVVMIIEKYWIALIIVLSIVCIIALLIIIIQYVQDKRKLINQNEEE